MTELVVTFRDDLGELSFVNNVVDEAEPFGQRVIKNNE
jgi:hypothetical protein